MLRFKLIDKKVIDYAEAWDAQRSLFNLLLESKSGNTPQQCDAELFNTLMLCEHPHVYTLGKSGVASNLLVDDNFLKSIHATYYKIDRGGDITYHGYGQLVGYPIIDLESVGVNLKEYIHLLEQSIIDTVAEYGVEAGRLAGATGVWIEPETPRARKIAAIGVKASRYVTMHGFALNINTDLKYFSYINPCGFINKGVTSLEKELSRKVDFEEVKQKYAANFSRIFGFEG